MSESGAAWRPSASIEVLRRRAAFLAAIREFFQARGVWEVETPLLSRAAVTDVHLASLETAFQSSPVAKKQQLYLHTSPEFFMKRLLAAGSGSIYQICKVFRNGEVGRVHNPEFTMLEWYRPGLDHYALMDEIDALMEKLLNFAPARRISYAQAFIDALGIDPHRDSIETIRRCMEKNRLSFTGDSPVEDRDFWLDLLFSHLIQPSLGLENPVFVIDFPASQAVLARKKPGPDPVAERFELFYQGVELANGFNELCDAQEQRERFVQDVANRRQQGLVIPSVDERFLAALAHGLPASAGVAVGLDRLFMVYLGLNSIAEVLSFDFSLV